MKLKLVIMKIYFFKVYLSNDLYDSVENVEVCIAKIRHPILTLCDGDLGYLLIYIDKKV